MSRPSLSKILNTPLLMASLKTFYQGKEPWSVTQFFDRMPWYFSVGFRWLVGWLKGRSDECLSVALPLFLFIAQWAKPPKINFLFQLFNDYELKLYFPMPREGLQILLLWGYDPMAVGK